MAVEGAEQGAGEAMRAVDARALTSALSVWLAVVIAMALQIEDPWWAAFAAFRTSLRTQSAAEALRRNRLAGTVVGCVIGWILAGLVVDDHTVALTATFALAVGGTYGRFAVRSGHGMLLGAASAILILNSALFQPDATVEYFVYRILETLLAVTVVGIVDRCFLPYDPHHHYPPPLHPTEEEKREFAIVACAAGFTVLIVALVFLTYDLPQPVQTLVTVLAVINSDVHAQVKKSMERFKGVFIGGGAGLLIAGLSIENFWLWSAVLFAGIAVSAAYFTSGRKDFYLGQQAGYGFIMAMVTGNGPVAAILPALDRMIGILFGVAIAYLILMSLYALLGRADTAEP
ncbi:MAG: hypothetical protein AcusKO_04410 [Acuticoccus sp.]